MQNQFTLYNLLIIIGIVQGFITSFLLLISKKNRRSNRFLALGIISFCFLSLKTLWHTLNLWETHFIKYFPNAVEVVTGPLMYFFVIYLLNNTFNFKRKHFIHFLPFTISQTYAFVVYFLAISTTDLAQKDALANLLHFNLIKRIEDYLGFLSLIIYISLGYFKLLEYKKWLNNTTSDNTYPSFNWLKNVFSLFAILGILVSINLIGNPLFNLREHTLIPWQLFNIFLAFLIYYLGFMGYKQPHYEISITQNNNLPKKAEQLNLELSNKINKAIKKALEEDKLFLMPTLSIKYFSKKININQRQVSQIINTQFNKSFRELINEYRVEEVKSKLQEANLKQLSILGIALECGFNSEASFYRIFKKQVGISPKEFINTLKS